MSKYRCRDDGGDPVLKEGEILCTKMTALDHATAPMHRPGFRTNDARRQIQTQRRIADAYSCYDAEVSTAWRTPPAVDYFSGGRAGLRGSDELKHAGPNNGVQACRHCRGSGVEPGHPSSGWLMLEEPDEDDEADRIVAQQTQTRHEGKRRFDVPDRTATLDAYRAYDEALQIAWKRGA
jgi:hypothetical protein